MRITTHGLWLAAVVSAWGWGSGDSSSGAKPEVGGRVVDLLNGEHFDDVLRDTPDELRPGGVVVFYRGSNADCRDRFDALKLQSVAETRLPARERLMVARYDIDLQGKRQRTDFSPEQDLPSRFGLDTDGESCPAIVYIPRACNGHTDWCVDDADAPVSAVGCAAFREQCSGWRVWDGEGSWVDWALAQIESEPWPALDNYFSSYEQQGQWIRRRETVTTTTHMRNNFLAPNLPKFSKTGTKMIKIPDALMQELVAFYDKWLPKRVNEPWDVGGATQMNFHEVGTDLVYLDNDPHFRDRIANTYLRPILEEWSGTKLKLNAFYGMREYFPGAWLRNHVDRIDTHVVSATLSVLKLNSTEPWPLETVTWEGKRLRYEHKPGEMLLYESSTRPHGRPYRMKDGIHVGCFVHFSPLEDEAGFRRSLAEGRRKLQSSFRYATYNQASTPSPADPVRVDVIVTPQNMKTKNDAHRRKVAAAAAGGEADGGESDGRYPVRFGNDMSQSMELLWVPEDDEPVRVALVQPGRAATIQTFEGHRFMWSSTGQSVPPNPSEELVMVMKKGVDAYTASSTSSKTHVEL